MISNAYASMQACSILLALSPKNCGLSTSSKHKSLFWIPSKVFVFIVTSADAYSWLFGCQLTAEWHQRLALLVEFLIKCRSTCFKTVNTCHTEAYTFCGACPEFINFSYKLVLNY